MTQAPIANALSIAGADPSGGAGIQADLKSFSANYVFGMAVITALTAQNTRGVTHIHLPPIDIIKAQINAIFEDIRVDAVKIGMVANAGIAKAVKDALVDRHCRHIVGRSRKRTFQRGEPDFEIGRWRFSYVFQCERRYEQWRREWG